MSDVAHMRRALELAAPRVGRTGDNPSIGCVLVKEGALVGEGATGEGGRPHAEEIALNAAGPAARRATAYVTLEPCAKRSAGGVACTDLLIAAGVARLVIAAHDPHPNAAGAGVARLRAAGVTVEFGLMEAEARALGINALHLDVGAENARALALYRRSGFRDTGRRLMSKRLV